MILKNNWSNKIANRYVKKYKKLGFSKDLALRVYTTRLLGRNPELVLHGGGNTSVKTTINDIDGKKYNVLCVKGSGWDMADIEPPGLPAVKLDPLLSLRKKKYLSDEDMVAFQKRNLIDIKSPNPSVETFLHAFLPYKYVDHTHADAVMNVTNRPGGLNLSKKIFGKKASIVPYVMPGFMLAKKVNEIYSENPDIECLILMNHGIFTFSNDCKKAYDLMIKYVSQAERAIKKLKSKKINFVVVNGENAAKNGVGITENIVRSIPKKLCADIDLSKIKILKIFKWLKKFGVSVYLETYKLYLQLTGNSEALYSVYFRYKQVIALVIYQLNNESVLSF